MTIGSLTEKVNLFVLPNLFHDIILGLDNISKFKLSINSNYEVFQQLDFGDEKIESNVYTGRCVSHPQINRLIHDSRRDKIDKLLSKYSSIFSIHKYDVGT